MQCNEFRDEADRHNLEIDVKFMDGDIATQVSLMHAAKDPQEGPQASPHALSSIGVDFANAIPVVVTRLFFAAMGDGGVRPLDLVVALVFICVPVGSNARELMHMLPQRCALRIGNHAQADLTRFTSDRPQDRRAVVGVGAPPPSFVRPAAWRVRRVAMLIAFFFPVLAPCFIRQLISPC